MKTTFVVATMVWIAACTRDVSDDAGAGLPLRDTGNAQWTIAGVAPGDARSAIEEKLACIFHGNAFENGSMGVRFFVRPTKAYRDMPREESGKANVQRPVIECVGPA
jgi:hypothetical protein